MMKSEKTRRTRRVDMSPEAIDRRMRDLAQLYKLGIAIQEARRLGRVEDLQVAGIRVANHFDEVKGLHNG